ncbi:RCC1 domain-containing protein [Candidatus Nitrotoga arctica]|nr:hypothetical protein [Candidatus Nitrotoga arctica]
MPGHAAESSAVAIAAGWRHTCALTTAGGVKCWGDNSAGQLGDNTTTNRLTPVNVSGLGSGVAAIAARYDHTCVITTAGGVKCWGVNTYGQLGDNTTMNRLTPVDVSGLGNGVAAIAASYDHTCALTTVGGVKCWGKNDLGQLGDDSYMNRLTPVDVSGLASGVAAIAAGGLHTCALTTAGGVKCWGSNVFGEIIDNYGELDYGTPEEVRGLSTGVMAIAAGSGFTCALTRAGEIKCLGVAIGGEMGNVCNAVHMLSNCLTPVDVTGFASSVSAIYAGYWHVCALTTAGGVKCWGNNEYGQLGNSVHGQGSSSIPLDVLGLASGVSAIAAGGGAHTCALTTAGGVKCWGLNTSGQLGDGSATKRSTPVDVIGLGGGVTPGPVVPASPLTGLWWNQNESGWGMSLTQRDSMAFLAWYTYDSIGKPTWFVISSCPLVGSGCTGDLYSVVGGTPLGVPWNGSGKVVTKVGTGSVAFSDNNTGTLNYSVNGVNGTKQITRQMFATGSVQPSVNYSALWWNQNESGWGVAITQQYGMIFATMYTYDASGNPVWYVASSCPLSGNNCAGDLYQVTGGSAPTVTWNDATKVVTKVGTVNFAFQNSSAGTLTYTINGVSGSKLISRQLF